MTSILPLIISYICNLIDYVFTEYWIRTYGTDIEANPIGRWLLTNNIGWFYKVFIIGALMALIGWGIYCYPNLRWTQYALATVYGALVIYHLVLFAYIGGIN